ncbi:unnamed protein product [Mycena citricolor]|uniref:BSD domain-containing protein n=1 Tax=Mycena citricolor TaxID=2018698 RepID=A0AAD2HSI7_9AGAR|nr:unnamed protein product [Mycena citricolor]
MNNFLDPYDLTAGTPPQQPEQTLDEEVNEVVKSFGNFWGNFRKQSQTALEAARKDLTGVVTQAQQEFSKLTSEGPKDVPTQPSSEKAGDEVEAGESAPELPSASGSTSSSVGSTGLFSRLQSALPPNIVSTVQSRLPETLKDASGNIDFAQMRTTLSTEFQRVQGVTRAQAEEYVQKSEALLKEAVKEAGDVLRDAVKVVPPSDSQLTQGSGLVWGGTDMWTLPMDVTPDASNKGKMRANTGADTQLAVATRAEALLKQLKHNPEIIKLDPAADADGKGLYEQWVGTVIVDEAWEERIASALTGQDGEALKVNKDSLVPAEMTEDVFWYRYFFRVHQIEQEENKRKALLQRSNENEEDFSWEDDDEAATSKPSVTGSADVQTLPVPQSEAVTPATASPRASSEGSYDLVPSEKQKQEEKKPSVETESDGDNIRCPSISAFLHSFIRRAGSVLAKQLFAPPPPQAFPESLRVANIIMGISERRKSRPHTTRSTRVLSRRLVFHGIRFMWVVVLIWGEVPEWRRVKPTHVLLLSDPQVRHPSAWDDRPWTGFLEHLLYESNLKRSWHVTRRLNPHAVFFLGDMLSNGKYARSEAEYKTYWRKFQALFTKDASYSQYFLPGNNDVAMGLSHTSPKNVRVYYSNIVGPFNREVIIRDHVFICLDAPNLVDEDYQRSGSGLGYEKWSPIRGGSIEFVKPDRASCGPLREKGSIRRGVGHGYQNTLGKQTTAFLLKTLRPLGVFSGDNRDYCEYNHTITVDPADTPLSIHEVTIKSFSKSSHIRRPGFQLVSVVDPLPGGKSFADAPCLLPDTSLSGSWYPTFAFGTVLFLVLFNLQRSRRLRHMPLPAVPLSPLSSAATATPLHPSSAIWSPFTPPVASSPRSALPSTLRTPNGASPGPTMRAASRPSTPLATPGVLGPTMLFPPEDEEEDSLFPPQYAFQRQDHHQEDWSSPEFVLPVAGNLKPTALRGWSWSSSFVLAGRRRRMTLSIPTWASFHDLASYLAPGADGDMLLRRKGIWWATVVDSFGIFMPALMIWAFALWMF